jgi:hypothetical protein
MLLQNTYEQFYKKGRLLNENVKDDKKNILELEKIRGEIYKSAKVLFEDIEKLRLQYLREKNPYLGKTLYRTISESVIQKLNISPEARVKAKAAKKARVA